MVYLRRMPCVGLWLMSASPTRRMRSQFSLSYPSFLTPAASAKKHHRGGAAALTLKDKRRVYQEGGGTCGRAAGD